MGITPRQQDQINHESFVWWSELRADDNRKPLYKYQTANNLCWTFRLAKSSKLISLLVSSYCSELTCRGCVPVGRDEICGLVFIFISNCTLTHFYYDRVIIYGLKNQKLPASFKHCGLASGIFLNRILSFSLPCKGICPCGLKSFPSTARCNVGGLFVSLSSGTVCTGRVRLQVSPRSSPSSPLQTTWMSTTTKVWLKGIMQLF